MAACRRQIGPFNVRPIGLGCMSMSHGYGPPDPAAAEQALRHALAIGYDFFDTAAMYGFGHNEELLGRLLQGRRQNLVLASKCGMFRGPDGKRVIDGRPETLQRTCEEALRRLRTEVIDLYYLHRVDARVPVEDSVGALARLVEQGKVRTIGLSEVSAATLRRAHAVHPLAALQSEYSLWTRNPELGTLQACRELGIAFVAFSPLGRGFLAGGVTQPATHLHESDLRRLIPRFAPGHFADNLALLADYRTLAREAACSPAQLALAWLLARAPHVIPIPGSADAAHVAENLAASQIDVAPPLLARLDQLINARTVSGARYTAWMQAEVDTECFPHEMR